MLECSALRSCRVVHLPPLRFGQTPQLQQPGLLDHVNHRVADAVTVIFLADIFSLYCNQVNQVPEGLGHRTSCYIYLRLL